MPAAAAPRHPCRRSAHRSNCRWSSPAQASEVSPPVHSFQQKLVTTNDAVGYRAASLRAYHKLELRLARPRNQNAATAVQSGADEKGVVLLHHHLPGKVAWQSQGLEPSGRKVLLRAA